MLERRSETTTFLNDPNQAYDQVPEEYAPCGVLAATFIRGIDLLFEDQSGALSYYATDDLGSTRALTTSAGAVAETDSYDAYGNLLASTGATVNPYLFTGEWLDAAIGQYYSRARDYDTADGRFTSADTFLGEPTVPQGNNKYVYAFDDPAALTDPSGNWPKSGFYSPLGTMVHSYIAGQFALRQAPNTEFFGEQVLDVIARQLGGNIAALGSNGGLEPDFVEANDSRMTVDIYEMKHVNLKKPGTWVRAAQQAYREAGQYVNALQPALPGYSVDRGNTWFANAAVDWGPLATILPAALAMVDNPQDHLYTFHLYAARPGAVLWEACTPAQEQQTDASLRTRLQNFNFYAFAGAVALLELVARTTVITTEAVGLELGVAFSSAALTSSNGAP